MGNLNGLDSNRLDLLERAVHNVLNTEVALETYAQIIDGLPLADVAHNQWTSPHVRLPPDHPINRHTSLCPGVLERTEQYRSEFGIHTLEFDENVVNAFQSAPFGKRHFQLRLIELVTLAVHQMAAQLFNKNLRTHDKHLGPSSDSIEAVVFWASQKPVHVSGVLNAEAHFFTHPSYDNLSSYPKRAGDVVGYWAEGRILGGVVSFAASEDPEPNPSLCSDRTSGLPAVGYCRSGL
ncbi:hypothetical protein C8A01DRAFT_43415 [Parachaetomium inaequale]|uniref:Uncharacterized protein n=1 Tax=Parachaetomium inaequale TaxID=2588326 RepID=A0AAN6PMB4_9PEZI|nr:hypothetical protein C8A01DRAFT_43415 [Parachaetomium inaequale]